MAKTTNNPIDLTAEIEEPSELVERARRGRQAWWRLGQRLRSITPRQVAFWGLIFSTLVLIVWLLVHSGPALIPFVVGAVLAYALLPVVNWLDKLLPRKIAALVSMLTVVAILALLIAFLIPALVYQYQRLVTMLPNIEQIRSLKSNLDTSLQDLPGPVREVATDAFDQFANDLRTGMEAVTHNLPKLTINALLRLINIIGAILGLLVLPTWLLIVLTEQRKGVQALDVMLPVGIHRDFWAIVRILDRTFRTFFQKQVTQGLLVGLLTFLGIEAYKALGLAEVEYPILAAIIAGLMELIPEIGPIVTIVIFGLAGLLVSPAAAIYFPGIYIVIHFLADGYVSKRAERRVREVHPAVLIVAVVALSELGLFWVLLSVPIVTAARDLFRYAYGRLSDPPKPAGLIPDEASPKSVRERSRSTTVPAIPLAYQRGRTAQPPKVGKSSKSG